MARKLTHQPQRFEFIHALRGFAALLVVWAHLSGFWLYSRGAESTLQDIYNNLIGDPLHLLYSGGHVAVVVFFLVSGFVITHVSLRERAYEFVVKRVLRIFPVLIVAILVTYLSYKIALLMGTDIPGVHGGSFWKWLSSLVLLDGWFFPDRPLNVTWTLVIEIQFYILTLLFISTAKKNALKSQWLMSLVWIIISAISIALPQTQEPSNQNLILYVMFLLLGRCVYLYKTKRISQGDMLLNGSYYSYSVVL